MTGDAAPCFFICGRLGWNLVMRSDLLERGLRELSIKYSQVENRGRMQIQRPFDVSSVASGQIGFQHLENMTLISSCSSMMWATVVHVDKTCKLEIRVIANHIISSLSCFDWKKHVVLNRLREEHHMEKLRTIFREEGEDDVTMATMGTFVAHIMDEQQDIKLKSSKRWNPIRPPATLLTSNGYRICIRPAFSAHEYLMESSRSPLSNGCSLITRLHLVCPQTQKQGVASPVMGLWACNFIWDPRPSGAHMGCASTRRSTTLGFTWSSSHLYLDS